MKKKPLFARGNKKRPLPPVPGSAPRRASSFEDAPAPRARRPFSADGPAGKPGPRSKTGGPGAKPEFAPRRRPFGTAADEDFAPPARRGRPPAAGAAGPAPRGPRPAARPFGKPAGAPPPFAKKRRAPFADDDFEDSAPERAPRPARPGFPKGKPLGRPVKRDMGDRDFAPPGRREFTPAKGKRDFTATPLRRSGPPAAGRARAGGPPADSGVRTKGKAAGRKLNLNFDDLIYGIHAVEEALRGGEEITLIYVAPGREREPQIAELIEAAKRLTVPIKPESAEFFANIPYKAHQGIIAVGKPFNYAEFDDVVSSGKEGSRLLVVLDHLTDPHNVGAILRTAECAGAQGALLPDRRSAGINATVRKAAAGATSHLPIVKVGNLAQTIRELKDQGYTVIGAAISDDARNLGELEYEGDIALVIGAEGEGLGRVVAKSCDELVKIPLMGKVESLNASVAAGILLYEVVRAREQGVS